MDNVFAVAAYLHILIDFFLVGIGQFAFGCVTRKPMLQIKAPTDSYKQEEFGNFLILP